jgi:hypothetical protein
MKALSLKFEYAVAWPPEIYNAVVFAAVVIVRSVAIAAGLTYVFAIRWLVQLIVPFEYLACIQADDIAALLDIPVLEPMTNELPVASTTISLQTPVVPLLANQTGGAVDVSDIVRVFEYTPPTVTALCSFSCEVII